MQNVEIMKVTSDLEADMLIEEIKASEEEFKRIEKLAADKIQMINNELQQKREAFLNSLEFKKAQLKAYFNTVKAKETKTSKKYKLLSGELIVKKESVKIDHDDKKIFDWCKSNADEYIKTVVTEKLDWSSMKSNLELKDGQIINKGTGEIIDCDGLKVVTVPEEFQLKY